MAWGSVRGLGAAALLLAACTGNGGGDGAADVRMHLSGLTFSGNSVRIRGTRVAPGGAARPADTKYRCANAVDRCFDLTGTNPSVEIRGLCATPNVPMADWTFEYEIYSAAGCQGGGGSLMNDGANSRNFQCFDSEDLYTRAHPNTTYEESLLPGPNDRSIACLSLNAATRFAFTSCSIEAEGTGALVLDCGCTATGGGCDCAELTSGPGGNLQDDADGRCAIDPSAPLACSIVCCATGLQACAGACVDTAADAANCGGCGLACAPGKACVSGACAP
jgi:hypothetical protein